MRDWIIIDTMRLLYAWRPFLLMSMERCCLGTHQSKYELKCFDDPKYHREFKHSIQLN